MDRPYQYPLSPEVQEEYWAEYYPALGQFMHNYAFVENGLNDMLTNFVCYLTYPINPFEPRAEMSDDIARGEAGKAIMRAKAVKAVTAGMRTSVLKDSLKRLMRIKGAQKVDIYDLNESFRHLQEISFIRDKLAHNAAHLDQKNNQGWFTTSNRATSKEETSLETITFKIEHLTKMSSDLMLILQKVSHSIEPEFYVSIGKASSTTNFTEERELVRARPWRYKPSELKRLGRQISRSPQSPKRPPVPFPP